MLKAVAWMALTLFSFCFMAVAIRELSGQLSTFQILFFRSLIGLVVLSTLMIVTGNGVYFRSQRWLLHTFRNSLHFVGQYCWFIGIGLLPLAEVFALEFTVPLWTALIAAFVLGERLTIKKCVSIALGLLGVICIVGSDLGEVSNASLIVLFAAVIYSIVHVATKSLSTTDNTLTVIFFMCLMQLPIGLLFAIPEWTQPNSLQWWWVVIIGITGLSAHFGMTKAMHYAEVSVVVTMDFLRLPLIIVVGVFLYAEPFVASVLIGSLFMLAGNLLNIYPSRAQKQ